MPDFEMSPPRRPGAAPESDPDPDYTETEDDGDDEFVTPQPLAYRD